MFLSEWRAFPSAPCVAEKKKNLMTARVSMLLKSCASLTCFRAYFFPGRAKDLSAPRYNNILYRFVAQEQQAIPYSLGVQQAILYYLSLCKYTFAQRRNRLTTHFSEGNPVVKRRISVYRCFQSHKTYSFVIVYYLAGNLDPQCGTSYAQRHTLRSTGCSSHCAHIRTLTNLVTIVHTEHDGTVERLVYTNQHSLLMGH